MEYPENGDTAEIAGELTRRDLLAKGARIGVALPLGATLFGGLACGGGATEEAGTPTLPEEFSGVSITVGTAGTPKQTVERAAAIWQKRTGGTAEVVEISYADLDTQYASILASSDSTFDVLYGASTQIGKFGTRLYSSIGDKMPSTDQFVPATTEELTLDGELLAVPAHSEMMVFIYNQRHFDDAGVSEVPSTWGELIGLSARLRDGRRHPCVYPVLAPGGFNARSVFLIMLNSTETRLLTPDLRDVAFENADGLLVLETLENAFQEEFFDPNALFLPSSYDSALLFNQGLAACQPHFSELWAQAVSGSAEFKAEVDPGDIKAGIMPGLRAGSSGSVNGFEGHGVSRFSRQPDAALSFILETVSPEVQKETNLAEGGLPSSLTSVLRDPDVEKVFPIGDVLAEQGTHNLNGYSAPYSAQLFPIFEDVLVKLQRGTLNASQAHDALVRDFRRVINEFYSS